MPKLYFLGPEGTYSDVAAKKIIDTYPCFMDYVPAPIVTISKIIKLVDSVENSLAILPVENSIEGVVRQTIDNIYQSNVKIIAQIELVIEHCLISKGKIENIRHIASHPQALAQCQRYISDTFSEDIDLIHAPSTAASVHFIMDMPDTYAAIARCDVARKFNLNLLAQNIADIKENRTRFLLVSKNDVNLGAKNRTSIVFNTKNEPGALLQILSIIYKHNLNLVYLESRPSKTVLGEYNFFADIDRGVDEIGDVLAEIKAKCDFYKFLGSYVAL